MSDRRLVYLRRMVEEKLAKIKAAKATGQYLKPAQKLKT